MAQNKFQDPAGAVSDYTWPLNHESEDSLGKTRNITRSAPTGVGGLRAGRILIKQQADDGPLLLKLTGKILERAQLRAMWTWYSLSADHTIYFTDFDGNKYECQMTSFQPKRVRVVDNPRGARSSPAMRTFYWEYTMEFEVYKVLAGDFLGVSP